MRDGPCSPANARFFYALLLAATALGAALPGSSSKPQHSQQSGDAQSSTLINFNFNVRDNHDHPVKSLSASQIHISVEGKEQTIESLTAMPPRPISIVFLVQQSNSRRFGPHERGFYPELQPALDCFRHLLASGASVQVAKFDNEPTAEGRWAATATDLFDSMLKLARSEPGGASAFFDSLAWASKQVAQRQGFRAIIVSADGHDNLSQRTLEESVAEVQAAKASLYIVNLSNSETIVNDKLIHDETTTLTELARRAGGESQVLGYPLDAKTIFGRIADDILTSYNVTFQFVSSKPQSELRSLKVWVDGNHMKVFAPAGDYTLPH
jgi:hypothetical protein